MKTILTIIFIYFFYCAFSQDTLKIKQIDALVTHINASTLPIQRDTLIQNQPDFGLKMTTYLTMIVNDGELLKYVNNVHTTMIENGITRQMNAENAFYYNHNELIKVEEYLIEGDKKNTADWYYSADKPLYYTLQSDKAADRAVFLLTLSKAMMKQIIK